MLMGVLPASVDAVMHSCSLHLLDLGPYLAYNSIASFLNKVCVPILVQCLAPD